MDIHFDVHFCSALDASPVTTPMRDGVYQDSSQEVIHKREDALFQPLVIDREIRYLYNPQPIFQPLQRKIF
jgi:hypothetical protein